MPRENQRRGKRAKQSGISSAKDDAPPPVKKAKPSLPEPIRVDEQEPAAEGEWPILQPDTKAYWQQLDERVQELLANGQGNEVVEEEQDDRKLLLKAALSNLSGDELALATDAEASVIFERLLHSVDDFGLRVLADRFAGRSADLAMHQFGSHVLQTLITLGSKVVARESKGKTVNNSSLKDDQASVEESLESSTTRLPLMSVLLLNGCRDFIPRVQDLLYNTYGSHLLRHAILFLSGKPLESAESFHVGSKGKGHRSKKSRAFKGQQGNMGALLQSNSGNAKANDDDSNTLAARPAFDGALQEIMRGLNAVLEGQMARDAAVDPIAATVVQEILNWERHQGTSDEPDSMLDRLLEGLVSKQKENVDAPVERSDYIETMLRESTSSHTIETILSTAPQPIFNILWQTYFEGRLDRLATHAVANFVVATAIKRLTHEQLEKACNELSVNGTSQDMLKNARTGPIKSLVERATALAAGGEAVVKLLLTTLGVDEAEQVQVLGCMIGLLPLTDYERTPVYNDPEAEFTCTLQGALLAQSCLRMPSPHNALVMDAMNGTAIETLLNYARNSTTSHVFDAALDSPTVTIKQRRQLILRLLEYMHLLADDRIGSRVVDKCWATADIYLKDKIAFVMKSHQDYLQASIIGHHFLRKLNLRLFQRDRQAWKTQLQNETATAQRAEVKKRQRQEDEVDLIFKKIKG